MSFQERNRFISLASLTVDPGEESSVKLLQRLVPRSHRGPDQEYISSYIICTRCFLVTPRQGHDSAYSWPLKKLTALSAAAPYNFKVCGNATGWPERGALPPPRVYLGSNAGVPESWISVIVVGVHGNTVLHDALKRSFRALRPALSPERAQCL
ncbi:hypothetical protein BS17DRAFT_810146 [Gyrodon lividus]|nr:hypothetical protein BS17DRAFT_810146 [Gyrodon lividus]